MRFTLWAALLAALLIAPSDAAGGIPNPPILDLTFRPKATAGTAPMVTAIPVPLFPGASALWGSEGCDRRGHIWFGLTAEHTALPSAHLLEFDPISGRMTDRGDAVSELKQAGLGRPGQRQMKIHSHIVQGPEGWLYFASMDEAGEKEDGSKLPTWGSHLWRYKPGQAHWQHLFAAPEGLIAVAGGGHFIFALGYFNHVLYSYDTRSGQVRRTVVGSVGGHISRNFLCDYRGHAYVPRLRTTVGAGGGRSVAVSLVEYDGQLHELHQTPLAHYLTGSPTASHGIVAFQEMAERSIFFTTAQGGLYRIEPPLPEEDGKPDPHPAKVLDLGWFNPGGPAYTASLFTPNGRRILYGLSRAQADLYGRQRYQWLAYDVLSGRCAVAPFLIKGSGPEVLYDALLYGSSTRDRQGNFYVVGTLLRHGKPVILRVHVLATATQR